MQIPKSVAKSLMEQLKHLQNNLVSLQEAAQESFNDWENWKAKAEKTNQNIDELASFLSKDPELATQVTSLLEQQ